ncbi:MAG: hypothetical protein OEV55_06330 [candidate division Zixibacteria bacterium]|nr:hypothetical protein [candidate division Zixibacteria bacterium]
MKRINHVGVELVSNHSLTAPTRTLMIFKDEKIKLKDRTMFCSYN